MKIHFKKENAKPEKKVRVVEANKIYRAKGGQREWQHKNKDKLQGYAYARMNKTHDISVEEWEQCRLFFNNECAYCGLSENNHRELYRQGLHRDHFDSNGLNDLSNCIPACKVCNSSKGENFFEDWFKTRDYYSNEKEKLIWIWLNEVNLKYINK